MLRPVHLQVTEEMDATKLSRKVFFVLDETAGTVRKSGIKKMHIGTTTAEKELHCNKGLNPSEGFDSHVGEGGWGSMVSLDFQEFL